MFRGFPSYLWLLIVLCGCNDATQTKAPPIPQAAPASQAVAEEPLKPKPIPDGYPISKQWQGAFLRAEKIELFSIQPSFEDDLDLPKLHGQYVVGSALIASNADK